MLQVFLQQQHLKAAEALALDPVFTAKAFNFKVKISIYGG
jgi:hypothetical protein